jgi:hypothetical protein
MANELTAATDQNLLVSNDFGASNEMAITFTASGSAAASSDVFLFPGVGVAAAKVLPTGVTYSGDFATLAEFLDYMEKNKLTIAAVRAQTNNVDNFAGKFTFGERKPNLQNTLTKDLQLTKFRESNGSTFADTININESQLGGPIAIRPAMFWKYVGLKISSAITFYLTVVAWEKKTLQQPIG